jgi:hypothetical protein
MGSFAWRPPFPEALRGKEPVGPRLLQLVNNAAQLLQDPLRVVAQHGCGLLVVSYWLMGRAARALSVIRLATASLSTGRHGESVRRRIG